MQPVVDKVLVVGGAVNLYLDDFAHVHPQRKGLEVELQHSRIPPCPLYDREPRDDPKTLVDRIDRIVTVKGNLAQEQRDRMYQIARMLKSEE